MPEPGNIEEGLVNKEGRSRTFKVSDKDWETLLHTTIVGNGIFPQAFFAQGIRLAQGMAEISQTKNLSLSILLRQDPSTQMIRTKFEKAKVRSHHAYGFSSASDMQNVHGLEGGVWVRDKALAQTTLESFARIIYDIKYKDRAHSAGYPETSKLFSKVQGDPLFRGLLEKASEALNSKTVRELSLTYKKRIAGFMQQYGNFYSYNAPPEYQEEQKHLMKELNDITRSATIGIKDELVHWIGTNHSQETRLQEIIAGKKVEELFGDISVAGIDPVGANTINLYS